MTTIVEKPSQVNILEEAQKDLKEANKQLEYWTNRVSQVSSTVEYLKEKTGYGKIDLPITKEEVEVYINGNMQRKSDGRVALFKSVIERTKKPLYYEDFCSKINELGDDVKARSFFPTIQRIAHKIDLQNIGNGTFDLVKS